MGSGTGALLERDAELAAADKALDAAQSGEGRLVLIEGTAGTGKSTLLYAVRERAAARGMQVLHARASELERQFPFGVALQLVEPALRAADDREALLTGAAGLAAPLLRGEVAAALPGSDDRAFPLIHGLHWLVANLAERGPLVVAVDDAQWADALSLRFLVYLAGRVQDVPVAAFVALRPGEAEPDGAPLLADLTATAGATHLESRPLGPDAVRALARRAVADLPDDASDTVWELTRGNPFLVRELLIAAAALDDRSAKRLRAVALDSVTRRVTRRLDRMAGGAEPVAHALAVLGDGAPLPDVARLAGLGVDEAARSADALAAADLVTSGSELAFVHPLVRNAVYEAIGPARAADAHARAARMLAERHAPGPLVAAHLLRSAPAGDPASVDLLLAAARESAARGSTSSAIEYLHRAVAEPPMRDRAGEVLLELGRLEAASGDPDAIDRLTDALKAAHDPLQEARVLLALGGALSLRGRRSDAVDAYRRGAELADGRDELLAAELNAAFIAVTAFDMSVEEAAAHARPLLARGPEADTPADRGLLAIFATIELVQCAPRDEVLAMARRAYGDGALVRELGPEGQPLQMVHIALFLAGDIERGIGSMDVAVEEARRRGSMLGYSVACQYRAQAYYRLGRLADAIADAESATAAIGGDWSGILPGTRGVYALALLERGDSDAAARALELDPEPGDETGTAFLLEARGHFALAHHDYEGARDAFLAMGDRFLAVGWVNPAVAPWRVGAALALARLGENDRARELANESLRLARDFGAPRPLGLALRASGLLDGAGGIAQLEEAVELLEEAEARLELARALADLGATLRRAGRPREARAPLERAMAVAHEIEAVRLEQQAADELAASGARPRRRALSGPGALTPSERRVAAMASQGLTNREIAQALFVTPKAIEKHLRNVYMKLDISSRQELASGLAADAA